MSVPYERDLSRIDQLGVLLQGASTTPIGDTLEKAIAVYEDIEGDPPRALAELALRDLRTVAVRSTEKDLLFSAPPKLPRKLSDIEVLQLFRIAGTIHELCYACEMVQLATDQTSGGSTPTRFYLNSIYHYVSSLFLVDATEPSHKGLPMGGTVIMALQPMGLASFLGPIKEALDRPLGDISLGETVLRLRHSDLVHGDFSPTRVEYLIRLTQMRDPNQAAKLSQLLWQFFHRLVFLYLQLLALLADSGQEMGAVTVRYMRTTGLIS